MGCRCTFDSRIYVNPSDKFCIIKVRTKDKTIPREAQSNQYYRDRQIRFTAVGYDLPMTDAVEMELEGEWIKGKYGMQLQVDAWQEIVPPTMEGLRTYLSSGLIKISGIPPCRRTRKRKRNSFPSLTYQDGILIEAATRGDGNTGEIVTHNASGISGIPAGIPVKGRLVITGEAFIRPSDFEQLKETLVDSKGEKYKNGRNLASGSVRLHKGLECGKRKVTFMPFAVLEGFPDLKTKAAKLRRLPELGFTPCKFLLTNRPLSQSEMESAIQQLRAYAKDNDIPIDGIVLTYNDIAFSESCGRTGHHYKDGVAFKFENEAYETVLQEIEWNTSRNGEIAPVAIFKPVVIDGCDVGRATLHNVSYIEKLELSPGCL